MNRDNPIYSDHKVLRHNLQSLLLCCSSVMVGAVDALVRAYRFKMNLEISGQGNPGYTLFVQAARLLGVRFEEKELSTRVFAQKPLFWISDHTTKNLRAWIPPMDNREGDLHVLLPFCFEHHLRELRKHDPTFPMPTVDNLYLLLIWSVCFGIRKAPLSARVLRDLLAWESYGTLTAHQYRGSGIDEVCTAHAKATTLTLMAKMYLGFSSGAAGSELLENSDLKNHPFNDRTRQFLGAMAVGTGSSDAPSYPWLIKSYSWDADKVGVILKNAWVLSTYKVGKEPEDIQKSSKCLELRLQGQTEDEIAKVLQFDSREKYDQWLVTQCIDTDSKRFRHPYEDWLSACKSFEVESTLGVAESLMGTSSESESSRPSDVLSRQKKGDSGKSPAESDPIPGFRHSPDFRSLRLPNGHSVTLTERQAGVIEMLHRNLLNETPEISQGLVINEVYGTVSENRLKRLFGSNELYDLLIEPGSRKGLVKLKTRFK